MVRIQDRLRILLNKAAQNIVFSLAKPPTPTYSQTPTPTCPPEPDCSTFYCPTPPNHCPPRHNVRCIPFWRRTRRFIENSYAEIYPLNYSTICGYCDCDCRCVYQYVIDQENLEMEYSEVLKQNFEEMMMPTPTPEIGSYLCKNSNCEHVEDKTGYKSKSCCSWECEGNEEDKIRCCIDSGGEWVPGCMFYNEKGECLEISYLPNKGKCINKEPNNIYYLINERMPDSNWNITLPTPTPKN